MPQSASADYQALDASPSKRPDFIFAVAGSPVLYAVADDSYALSAGAHDLSSTNGFTTIRKWAALPEISGAKMKGAFPEGGGFDIGDMKVELLDKHGTSTTTRDLTDLLSRQAYLEGNQTGGEYELTSDPLTKAATTINLVSTTGITAGDVIHISQEAILVGTVAGATQLTGCTRGYLLTNATRHEVGVKVYGYLPNLIGRPCWLYKGYRDLTLASWLEAWGGLVTAAHRSEPGKVTLQARATTWAMWGGSAPGGGPFVPPGGSGPGARSPTSGVRRLVRIGQVNDDLNEESLGIEATDVMLGGDFYFDFKVALAMPTGLGDGHFVIRLGSSARSWWGVTGDTVNGKAYTEQASGDATKVSAWIVRANDLTGGLQEVAINSTIDVAWTNATFSTTGVPVGSDPVDLILQFLTSTGTGTNGDYDDFKKGIGLAIPVEQIDLTSFTDVQAEYDYGTLRVFFMFSASVDAKTFIDEELCRPFGWYIATGNDGRIRLVRPKNPAKVHFSEANNQFRFTHSKDSSTVRQFTLPAGVYTTAELTAALQAGFRTVSGDTQFGVSRSGSTGIYSLDVGGGGYTLTIADADSWRTLGFATFPITADANPIADNAVGFGTVTNLFDSSTFGVQTVTKNDVIAGSASVVPNGAARVGRVNFGCNYSWAENSFEYQIFEDAEVANLSPFGEASP